MFSIGEFARHGRVSVRMLRHYDAIGLLQPAHVDPVTARAGLDCAGHGIAYYEDSRVKADAVVVHAAVQVAADLGDVDGFSVVDLPEVDRAATIIHHGSMDDVLPTGQALARWIDATGLRSIGYARELMVEWSPDPEQWVTELQQPIGPAAEPGLVQQEE